MISSIKSKFNSIDKNRKLDIVFIGVVFLILTCVFPNAFIRFAYSIYSLFSSVIFYIISPFTDAETPNGIYEVITGELNSGFIPSLPGIDNILPNDMNIFGLNFSSWFFMAYNSEYFMYSIHNIGQGLYNFYLALYIIILIVACLLLFSLIYFSEKDPEKVGKTKSLIRFEGLKDKLSNNRIISNTRDYVAHIFSDKLLIKSILIMLGFYTSIFSTLIDLLSLLFVFIPSLDLFTLYKMLYVSFYEIVYLFQLFGLYIFIITTIIILVKVRRNRAKRKIEKLWNKAINLAIDYSSVSTLITGVPGSGKTTIMTSLLMSSEEIYRSSWENIMFKYMMFFPSFPFNKYELWINKARDENVITQATQLKAFILKNKDRISEILSHEDGYYEDKEDELKSLTATMTKLEFDYKTLILDNIDLNIYDGLRKIDIYDLLIDYGMSYMLYSDENSCIYSNYSVRSSYLIENKYFPNFNTSLFLENDVIDIENYSHYSTVMDFDKSRLGLRYEPNKGMADCGVRGETEIDKDRGNKNTNVGFSAKDNSVNPLTDKYNEFNKLARHPYTIDFIPFYTRFSDTQRSNSVNSDLVETFETTIYILSRGKVKNALFLYRVESAFYETIINRINSFILRYRRTRNYISLTYCILSSLFSKIYMKWLLNNNNFGYKEQNIRITQEGIQKELIYPIIFKKVYAQRFATDCYYRFFESAFDIEKNLSFERRIYQDIYPTKTDFEKQNSIFIKTIEKLPAFSNKPIISKKEQKENEYNEFKAKYLNEIVATLKEHKFKKKTYLVLKKKYKDFVSFNYFSNFIDFEDLIKKPTKEDGKEKE